MSHDTTSRHRQYWFALYSVLRQAGGVVQGRNTAPGERFADFAVGRGGFSLCARVLRDCIAVELNIVDPDADSYFDRLQRQRRAIHLGYDLLWLARGPRSKGYRRISTRRHTADFQDVADWPRQHRWFAHRLDELHRALAPRVVRL